MNVHEKNFINAAVDAADAPDAEHAYILASLFVTLAIAHGASPADVACIGRYFARGLASATDGTEFEVVSPLAAAGAGAVLVGPGLHRDVLERLVHLADLGDRGELWFCELTPAVGGVAIDGLVVNRAFLQACRNLVDMGLASRQTRRSELSDEEQVRYLPTDAGRAASQGGA